MNRTTPPPIASAEGYDISPIAVGDLHRPGPDIAVSTDPLTGALQRAELAPALAAACQRASSVGILLIDIDHFKSINDAYGHAAGDAVLQEFGVRVRAALRGGDFLVRYGGDEFVVVLPNAPLSAAHEVAERLQVQVGGRPFPGTLPLTVTLSIGCTVADATTVDLSLSSLIARADAHVYQAKRRGRNQVVSVDEAPPAATKQVVAVDAQGRLIERDGAFAQLLAWLDALSEGERGLMRVLGAPGVGMTRFLRAVESTARLRGYQVLVVAGSPALRLRHYGALAEALIDTGDSELPNLQHLMESVHLADATGLLVVVDRASEVDAATLELLWKVAAHPAVGRVGLVVGLDLGLSEMGRLPDLPVRAEIRLQPFSLAALRVWLRGALLWEAPTELSAWLHERTDGYPALLEAAVLQLADDGMLTPVVGKGGWHVSPFIQEYPLRDWLLRARAREEAACVAVRSYGHLVGRSAELRALKRALAEQRVVVLAGHGGVGKTHLALQVAAELGSQFADGVVVVPLATATAAEFVASALARSLGLAVAGRQEAQAVALEFLTGRDVLVVFDAVEHVPGLDVLIQDLIATPGVRLLITTREAVNMPAEAVFTLHGLRDEGTIDRRDPGEALLTPSIFPQAETTLAGEASLRHAPSDHRSGGGALLSSRTEHVVGTAASALFLQASGLSMPAVLPAGESLAAIERIFRLVRGYPLAIKMLASWTAFFGYEEIAELLTGHVRRRATSSPANDAEIGSPMPAVFDFFWSLLGERDRQSIGGLTCFQGGFTAEAAFGVADVTPFLLAALRDRSFVQTDRAGRYYLHELLRQYAWEWLAGDTAAITTREELHATWFARLAAASATDMRGPRFRQWVDRLEAELDNMRRALDWALTHAPLLALAMALDLTEFWLAGLHPSEGHRWIGTAMARAEDRTGGLPLEMRVRALGRLGRLERQYGDTAAARLHLTTAVTLAEGERTSSGRELAYSLSTLANIESDVGAHEPAVSMARQALDHARCIGSLEVVATTANVAVWPFIFAGAFEEATSVLEEGLQASAACGDHRSTANLTNAKATIAYYDPARHDEAIALYQHVINIYEELRDWSGLLLAFNNLASVYVDDNRFELAAHAFADALRIGRRVKQHRMMPNVLSGSGIVASIRGDAAAAWGFWRDALELALVSSNMIILEECAIGLAYVWARAGFAAHAAVLIGMVGLQPGGKPWLLPPIERASAATQPALTAEQWEKLLMHGAGLDLSATARLLCSRTGPHDVPESILPALAASGNPH